MLFSLLCAKHSTHTALNEAYPIKARPGRLDPLGLAELMFLKSTPGRMGNLLIPITAPRNQIGLRRFVIWG